MADNQLQENTVQHTLCIPLWGRKIATENIPHIFPDFDAANPTGLKFVNAEVKMAGNETKSFFSLTDPKSELEAWSKNIINVSEKDYVNGYLKHGYKQGISTKAGAWLMKKIHWSFMIHAEFKR